MFLDAIAPNKFLGRWELRTGSIIVGVCMCLLKAASTVAAVVNTMEMSNNWNFWRNWKSAYGFSVTSIIYCVFMFLINVWFLWGVRKEKATVVLSWVVVTAAWMAQSVSLLIVLLCIYSTEANFVTWIVCLVFSCLAFSIFFYGFLVVYGYWLQLKNKRNANTGATAEN